MVVALVVLVLVLVVVWCGSVAPLPCSFVEEVFRSFTVFITVTRSVKTLCDIEKQKNKRILKLVV